VFGLWKIVPTLINSTVVSNRFLSLSQRLNPNKTTMKTIAILVSTLLGSAALAAPLETRIVAQEFDVSDFSAGCVPHGTQCS
jgi:hypothetical protein